MLNKPFGKKCLVVKSIAKERISHLIWLVREVKLSLSPSSKIRLSKSVKVAGDDFEKELDIF